MRSKKNESREMLFRYETSDIITKAAAAKIITSWAEWFSLFIVRNEGKKETINSKQSKRTPYRGPRENDLIGHNPKRKITPKLKYLQIPL